MSARHLTIGLLALLLVAGGILLMSGRNEGPSPTTEARLDKSKGDPDAPVVVTVYGDFQ
ncbi:MAG TPA: hypothetical protein G4O02_16405 [Caldilineae bacterium]|nr:hypothetical protein [Caldilineae bacterium]